MSSNRNVGRNISFCIFLPSTWSLQVDLHVSHTNAINAVVLVVPSTWGFMLVHTSFKKHKVWLAALICS